MNYWSCNICHYLSVRQKHVAHHIESNHVALFATRNPNPWAWISLRSVDWAATFVMWLVINFMCKIQLFKWRCPPTTCISSGERVSLSHEELENFISENLSKYESGVWSCNICGFQSMKRNDAARHIEARHVEMPPLPCQFCTKSSKTRDALRQHIKIYHQQ